MNLVKGGCLINHVNLEEIVVVTAFSMSRRGQPSF